jgi:hypothetical protein
MDRKARSSEKGQAVVLIAIAMVVLLGFTALAIDGSMVYSDRRYAQNGADASSLAGGGAAAQALGYLVTTENWTTIVPGNCRDGNAAPAAQRAKEAAQARAAGNDFTITPVIYESEFESSPNAVWTECGETVIQPVGFHRKYMDVYVKITHDTPTSFAQFVFSGIMRNVTTAVTRVYPAEPYGFGEAIIALNPSDHCPPGGNNSMGFSGGPEIEVDGGGVFSNGCVNGNSSALEVTLKGGSSVFYGTGLNTNPTSWVFEGGGSFQPITDTLPLSQFNPLIPDCTGYEVTEADLKNRTDLEGLYCLGIDEDLDLTCHGSCDTMAGTDLTIVMRGGKFTINDGVDVDLIAPSLNYVGPAMPGVLLYLPIPYYGELDGSDCGDVNQEVKINGSATSDIVGTILAPCSDVSLEGSATTSVFNSQVIGWNVNVQGGGTTAVVYDDSLNGHNPGNINLFR